MKNKTIFLLALLAIGMSSCRKQTVVKSTSAYNGKWSLVSYNPSPMAGSTYTVTYTPGDVVWDFDATNQTVAVSVNPLLSTIPVGPGNYTYVLGNHLCNYGNNQSFNIGNDNWGVFVLDSVPNNKLKITAECVDGAKLQFER